MKKVKLLFTTFAAIAIAGGVLAAKYKNSATYYSCDQMKKCTVSHQITNINEFEGDCDGSHSTELTNATTIFNADCPTSNCGKLCYGDGE